MRLAIPLILLTSLAATAARAASDDAIVTDRPDFVESADVVGKGRVQIETSVAVERNRAADLRERTTSTPALLRVGVGDTLELRVESDGRMRYRADGDTVRERQRGWADTAVGVKWHALDGAGGKPSVGVLLHADLDTGSAAFRGEGVRPSVRVAAEWEFPGDVGLGLMPGLLRERGADGGHIVTGMFGIVLGKTWNERWRGFVELSAPRIAHARDGGSEATVDVGGSWLLTNNCQVDAMLSRGLNHRTPDLAFTLGLSVRL